MPRPQRYYYKRPHKPWGRHARLELALTVMVVLAMVATILFFLLVVHDVPFRTGQPT